MRQKLQTSEVISKNLTTVRVAGSVRDVAVFGDLLFAFRRDETDDARRREDKYEIVCDDALTVHSFLHHS